MIRPKDVADQLAISPATLRLWSNNFSPVLSPAAQKATTENGTAAQRRYTDQDLAIFRRAKQLLADGLTYEQTLDRLRQEPPPETLPASETPPPEETRGTQLVTEQHPIIRAFEEALRSKDGEITALRAHITLLEQKPPVQVTTGAPVKFRWGFLNRLLLDTTTHGDNQ